MSGRVQSNSGESANAPYIYPPTAHPGTAHPGYEPPNVHDGYDKFIQDILSDGHADTFEGPHPRKDEKKENRINQFLKWSGIAFAVTMGATILKKALTYSAKGAKNGAEEALKRGVVK